MTQSFKKAVTFLVDENEYKLMAEIMARNIKRKSILSRGIAEFCKELEISLDNA